MELTQRTRPFIRTLPMLLLIRAGLEGIRKELAMPRMETASGKLPATLRQAVTAANRGKLCKTLIPQDVLGSYLSNKQDAVNDYTKAKKKMEFDRETYFEIL